MRWPISPGHDDRAQRTETSDVAVNHALSPFGWTVERDVSFDPQGGQVPGRVVRHDRGGWTVITEHGDLLCGLRGRLRTSLTTDLRPGVGDWVAVTPRVAEGTGTIERVLPRTSVLLRDVAGERTEAQVIAANVDTVFICVPSDAAANPRRIERELALVAESGTCAVLVVTKSDLEIDTAWVDLVAGKAPIVLVNSLAGDGISALDEWNTAGATLVVIGPSGAGKSTLANGLLGEARLATGAVRGDDKRGRHTTSWRELVMLPSGALLIDTPGVREISLWEGADGIAEVFNDIEDLAEDCRFVNCGHDGEPGCAVQAAIADGSATEQRFAAYRKLQGELNEQTERNEARAAATDKRRAARPDSTSDDVDADGPANRSRRRPPPQTHRGAGRR